MTGADQSVHSTKYTGLQKRLMILFYQCFLSPHRSYGVVLWELLTGEIPYKDVDSTAIIWGVGSASLLLPIPDEMPEGFKLLLKQCW